MADKNTLLALNATNLPDNTNEEISPADVRGVNEQVISSNANLDETTLQSFSGPVEFNGGVTGVGINNRLIINQFSDFPEPMIANTQYYIGDEVALPDTLPASWANLPSNIEFAGSVVASKLTWGGAGYLFSGSDMGRFRIINLLIDAPNADLYNLTETTTPTIVNLLTASVSDCKTLGIINVFGLVMDNINIATQDSGLTTGDSSLVFSASRISFNSTSAAFVCFDVTNSVFSTFELQNLRCTAPAGAIGLKGVIGSGNVAANQVASVTSCEFLGGITDLSGITTDDIRWLFSGNTPTKDTLRDALIYSSSSLTTTITTAETYVKVNATWGTETISGFSADTTGRITWVGERAIKVPVDMSLSVNPAAGTNKTIRTRIAVNGVTLANSTRSTRTDSGDANSVTTPWQITFQPGDYVEAFVTSADATDVNCQGGIVRIN